MRHEIFSFFFFFLFGRGEGKFRIHYLLQKFGFNFKWAVSIASHPLWIFFFFHIPTNEKTEEWTQLEKDSKGNLWIPQAGNLERQRERHKRGERQVWGSSNHKSHLSPFIHCDELAGLHSQFQSLDFQPRNNSEIELQVIMQESEEQNLQFHLVVGSSLTKTSNPTSGISLIYRNLWILGRFRNHCPVTVITRMLLSHENCLKMHQHFKKKIIILNSFRIERPERIF